ncbi:MULTISPECIES: hypothetical protein [unclassified Arthrobacter]|uniref:hypothetical protein n=1 Tax=unclassified Arthrobacter TaxID=235627 RepID=UPI00159D57C5|nr:MULTISPECIES: hypothetical protein [unclassified Arthrobacter]MCQ9165243.1 hypothetical protein [Arthrobacter sp. STN4]NVM99561.1 hypothetical protein [Arthrobacter sp. SDTb3-6]
MPAVRPPRRRVEFFVVPFVAAVCMAFIIGAIVMDKDSGGCAPASWHNRVMLTLAGNQATAAQVDSVTACVGAECVPLTPTFARKSSSGSVLLARQPDGSWQLKVGTQPASSVTFRAFDASGKVLGQQSNTLNWTRVGGNEKCGGPMADLHVDLQLP